ncbi:2',5'-phosphodiesterase 12 isoform X1 [Ostrinia nubilalis]|uniref:2',5'-phosphodiesterase 12 isoform X1 n=1 Tax=Ostrinia nubilalis TaxID=29057 RepID=UPI0030825B03
MILRLQFKVMRLRLLLRRFSSLNISKTKAMNSEKCYFRYIQKEETVDITFLYKIKDSVRQFNFSRKPTETLQNVFVRIATNIQKAIKKADKKKAKEGLNDIEIKLVNVHNDISEQSSCLDLFNTKEPIHLKFGDQMFRAVFNAPWVVNINLPQSILMGFPVYPDHLALQYASKETSLFKWYTGFDKNEKGNEMSPFHIKWELVGESYTYTPTAQDVGKKLKIECIPGNGETTGPTVEAISKNVVEAGPGKCPFETRHMFTASKLTNNRFRCVTYNILADLYCDSDHTREVLYPYCPPYALSIDYRKQLILKELTGYNADILCLQEVDAKIFNHYLQPLLQENGLHGVFYKKGKEVAEGLALFYRMDRFRILGEEKALIAEVIQTKPYLQEVWNNVKENNKLTERLLDRSTVASATFLQPIENPNEILLVGNTHLYFHPDADHIRLIQGGILIYWLNDVRNTLKNKFPGKRISVIVCGDFNSDPLAGIYKLFTTGSAPNSLPDWKSNLDEAISHLSLNQETILASACGTPPCTNYTAGFAGCLDYIYYEKACFQVVQVVPLPSLEEIQAYTALPSIVFPSDHIALVADLEFSHH